MDFRSPCTAKWLTRRPSYNKINFEWAKLLNQYVNLCSVSHIDFKCFSPEVGSVRFQSRLISINRYGYRPARRLNTRTKTSRT